MQAGSLFAELRRSSGGHRSLAAALEPLAAVLPPLLWPHRLISATSVLPSQHPPYLLLNIYRALGLLSSTQLPARESRAVKARHAVGQRGQNWGWEKMASAGVVLPHAHLTLTPVSPLSAGMWPPTTPGMAGLENDAPGLSVLESCWLNSHVREHLWR